MSVDGPAKPLLGEEKKEKGYEGFWFSCNPHLVRDSTNFLWAS
jgi:hypothetical protein